MAGKREENWAPSREQPEQEGRARVRNARSSGTATRAPCLALQLQCTFHGRMLTRGCSCSPCHGPDFKVCVFAVP